MRFGLEIKSRLLTPDALLHVVRRRFADGHAGVRQIGQLQHQGIALLLDLRDLFVQFCDALAHLPRLHFPGLGFRRLFLRHQGADLLGNAIAAGLELFDLRQDFSPLLIQAEELINLGLVIAAARRQAFPDEIGLFTNQFDIEHRRNIGCKTGFATPLFLSDSSGQIGNLSFLCLQIVHSKQLKNIGLTHFDPL